MLHATKANQTRKPTRRKVRFKGITADAKTLGVNRVTLWRVLNGDWTLHGLRRRYDDLQTTKPNNHDGK